jgi:superfamily I DNA and/or RNA helicase
MLDLLAGPAGPNPEPVVDPAIQSVLEEMVAALEDRTAGQPDDGVALTLLDYRDALEGDPAAVEWTLREYTASYAATCQQVASPGMRDAKLEDRIDDILFDTVIVDEAARANPLDLMIPLNHAARRIVLVGDHKQLPHMLEPDVERELDADIRDLLDQSMFERLFTKLGKPDAPVRRVVTLDTQFRMHPVLGSFVSRNFYDNGLESGLPDTEFAHGLRRFGTAVAAWLAVGADQGVEQGDRSKFRPAEAQVIADELADLVTDAPQLTFGVISFYAAQVQEIWQALAHPDRRLAERTSRGYRPVERLRHDQAGNRLDRLHVGTVDAFQGREFDVVFLSVTRSARPAALERRPNPSDVDKHRRWVARCYGHLTLINRLCVAMSRQKRLLIAVGDPAMCEPATAPAQVAPLADFLRLCGGGAPHGYLG